MILAFNIADIIKVPFGWLLTQLYEFTFSYGWALIIFAIVVKLVLLPATAKGKKSSMKMSRLSPQLKQIQEKYADDQQRQSEEMRALYKREGVSVGGSCLWSLLPLLILFPLYAVVRQPIIYMLGESQEVANTIVSTVKELAPDAFTGNSFYEQMVAATLIPQFAEQIKAVLPGISAATLEGVNFSFLGINLGAVPTFNIFGSAWVWDWAHIGAFLIPVLSAGSQLLSMAVAQKMNNSLVTDENGIQDKETAEKSQANQQNKIMMWMMPIMSLWIGFGIPAALSLYWFAQGVVSLVSDVYLTQKYRKIYDLEDAERLKKLKEAEAIEAEKERLRAERRAANPEGITANTSKKKMQQAKQKEQEKAKAAAAKEYAIKKGMAEEQAQTPEDAPLSGISERPNCKGRAFDPNRYSTQSTEE